MSNEEKWLFGILMAVVAAVAGVALYLALSSADEDEMVAALATKADLTGTANALAGLKMEIQQGLVTKVDRKDFDRQMAALSSRVRGLDGSLKATKFDVDSRAKATEVAVLTGRVDGLGSVLASAPWSADIAALTGRVEGVETAVSAVSIAAPSPTALTCYAGVEGASAVRMGSLASAATRACAVRHTDGFGAGNRTVACRSADRTHWKFASGPITRGSALPPFVPNGTVWVYVDCGD